MNSEAVQEQIAEVGNMDLPTLREYCRILLQEMQILSEQVDDLRRKRFGRRSEKMHSGQLKLFALKLAKAHAALEEKEKEEEKAVAPRSNKKGNPKGKGHGRKNFGDHLPRDTMTIELSAEELPCKDCGQTMKEIGRETCERGHLIPAKVLVKKYVKVKYACPAGHHAVTAKAPPALIDRCKFEASVFAHVAAAKYGNHIPMHRLKDMLKRRGISLPTSTMWDMLKRVSEIAAQPILAQMRKELLQERILQSDDTSTPVVIEGKKGSKKGCFWTWRWKRKVLYDFTLDRKRDGPEKFLEGWVGGTLLTDGATTYPTESETITRAGCWAHCRRKFKEAADVKTPAALPILLWINRLFRLERAVTKRVTRCGLSIPQALQLRLRIRQARSRRLLERIDQAANTLASKRSTLERSKLGRALTYLENQNKSLRVFLNDPELPMHNNGSESAIRPLVLGRKNWQITGSPLGGKVAANLYSLVYSCKAIGVDAEAYLCDVLQTVSTTPESQVATLTPWAWLKAHPEALVTEPFAEQ